MSDNKKYQLYVKNYGYVKVDKEVYAAYYKHKEHNKYLLKKARQHTVSYEQQNEFGMLYDYLFAKDDTSLLDQLVENEKLNQLYDAIDQLDQDERDLIYHLYFYGLSERKVANNLCLTQQAVHYRKTKVLKKLREILMNLKT